jgi:AbrB family looped-hinge helix DNA binding protein
MTSKGRVTIPKTVREAPDLHDGDELLFRVEDSRAVVAKTPDFISMAGSVAVPPTSVGRRGMMFYARRAGHERSAVADGTVDTRPRPRRVRAFRRAAPAARAMARRDGRVELRRRE